MPDAEGMLDALDQSGRRITEPRRVVASLIGELSGHFTADQLLQAARRRHLGVGRATVFRSLELFTDLGVVERLDLPSGEHAYVACDGAHHHHVVCSSCGRAKPVDDGGVQAAVESLARRTGYEISSHRLELFGVCPDCQVRRVRAD